MCIFDILKYTACEGRLRVRGLISLEEDGFMVTWQQPALLQGSYGEDGARFLIVVHGGVFKENKQGMDLMRFKEKLFQQLERKGVYQVVQRCFKASILGVFQDKMSINLKKSGLSLTLNFFEEEVGIKTFGDSFCLNCLELLQLCDVSICLEIHC